MQYVFILGREPLLSLAEITSVLNRKFISYKLKAWQKPFCVIETPTALIANDLMQDLGGTIKIAEIFSTIEAAGDKNNLTVSLQKSILNFLQKKGATDKKVFFGLSFYQQEQNKFNSKNWGLEIKNKLKDLNINSRLVTSLESILSAVTVKKNKLLSERGAEIILLPVGNQFFLAVTLAVQPFEEFSQRDFGRPGRDAFSGMLPPKLAKIMLNLAEAKPEETILDPFCGSGTILTEALILGYPNLIGSDISAKAINDTQQNIDWLKSSVTTTITKVSLLNVNVQELDKKLNKKVDCIVTEPFLGKPLTGHESPQEIEKQCLELTNLYEQAFRVFSQILKKGGRVIFIFPRFQTHQKTFSTNINKKIEEMGFKSLPLLDQEFLNYERPGQKVAREIWRFKKN